MRAVARHLLELGHRKFAMITGGPERPARERRAAVEEELAERATVPRAASYDGVFSVEYGARAATAILSLEDPRPTAIIASGNMLMHGALLILHDAGVGLGRDVSFVGCDDIAIASSTIRPSPSCAGTRPRSAVAAAELMLAVLGGDGRRGRARSLPTEFVARASCGPAPA